jgi:hypothetical protein
MGFEFLKTMEIFAVAFCVTALCSATKKVPTFRRNHFRNLGKVFAVPKRQSLCSLRETNFLDVLFVFTYLVCLNAHLLQ